MNITKEQAIKIISGISTNVRLYGMTAVEAKEIAVAAGAVAIDAGLFVRTKQFLDFPVVVFGGSPFCGNQINDRMVHLTVTG